MQCTDRKKSDKQLIPNTLQYIPILYNETTQNARHGIQWTIFSQLEDLDYTDDIALLPAPANHPQNKAQLLTENYGIQIIQKKTKVMCMNLKEYPHMKIDEEELEVVSNFTYLGNNISVENSVQKDI